jgi:repressor LexA
MTIGEKIKELRTARDMTKTELATRIGTHRNAIKWWESGRNEPRIFSCILLADVFDITLDELCCRGDLNV